MKVDDDGWFGGGRGGWRGRAARAGGECLEIAKVWCFLVDSNYLCVYRRYHTHQFLATFNRQLLSTLAYLTRRPKIMVEPSYIIFRI